MNKFGFKVGDKVERIGHSNKNVKKGQIYTIKTVFKYSRIIYLENDSETYDCMFFKKIEISFIPKNLKII